MEIRQSAQENEALKRELETAREKCVFLEGTITQWQREGAISVEKAAALADSKESLTLMDWSRRLASLETRELNERERGNHLQRLFEHQKVTLIEYEKRNVELEKNFSEV